MPQPDRTKDNSTYWTPDFSVQHYKDMLFTPGGGSYGNPSLTDFYQELSSGRFAWDGQVSKWTTVNGSKADFGANSEASGDGGDDANGPVSRVVKATLDGLASSGDYGGIDIAKVDKTDRYDCDHDARRQRGPQRLHGAGRQEVGSARGGRLRPAPFGLSRPG